MRKSIQNNGQIEEIWTESRKEIYEHAIKDLLECLHDIDKEIFETSGNKAIRCLKGMI